MDIKGNKKKSWKPVCLLFKKDKDLLVLSLAMGPTFEGSGFIAIFKNILI